ncbi:glycosyltransferase family 39 protein [Azospirillum halopraeferens]|uniref:glycosyltransferase family 39 protein n=1 Tax=Azospirillum halopraeferens TaxID=34010 RepID=UPI00040AA2EB|nr:glycosyltransferase family 39 protein [Azospirillum halopraeferens]
MTDLAPAHPHDGFAALRGTPMTVARPATPGWDDLTRLLLLALAVLALLTFRNYGITIDEEVQHLYGKKLLAYYASGFADHSAFVFKDLFYYGGLFDLTVAALLPVSPFAEYDTRHLLCAAIGIIGIAGAWRLARRLGGPRAGFLAAALLALTGVYYGAMFNNTKDVPFAAGMVWALYFATCILDQAPRPRRTTVLKFGLVLGLTLATRVGGVLAVGYLGLGLLALWVLAWRRDGAGRALSDAGATLAALLPALPLTLAIVAVFWPWVVQEPGNILKALQVMSKFPINLETLFNGHLVPARDPPALYLPVYLAVKLPEAVLVGLAAAAGLAAMALRNVRSGTGAGAAAAVRLLPLVLAATLPVVLFMVLRPTIYNGVRHFLFVVPPLVVLAAIGIDGLWRLAERGGRTAARGFAALLVAAGVHGTWQLASLHPNEYVYYNTLVGGPAGADGRYELDYWGNSILEAVRRLEEFLALENDGAAPPRTYTVMVCGNALAARYELPPHLVLANGRPDWREADFFVTFTQDRICPDLLDGRPIIEIAADGVPLSIVKDRRPRPEE